VCILEADPRRDTPDRPAIGKDEFIAGTAPTIAEQIIEQCRADGAGNFAAVFDRSRSPEGTGVIPPLRLAAV
jgi:hypothetical protein